MEAINIKAFTENSTQIEAIKAFMQALKIKFEVIEDSPYDSEFVQKIQQGDEDLKNEKGKVISLEELDSLRK